MSREQAKAFYDLEVGDPTTGYITPLNAQQAIDKIYDDLDTGPGIIDHGLLEGLADDDHTQYVKADTVRNAHEWSTASSWANLPGSGNWPGRKILVQQTVGLLVALYDGTSWVVSPESMTPAYTIAGRLNGWVGGTYKVQRMGYTTYISFSNIGGSGASNNFALDIPLGFRPSTVISLLTLTDITSIPTTTVTGQVSATQIVFDRTITPLFRSGNITAPTTDAWPTAIPT
jgi:hypothetical protein